MEGTPLKNIDELSGCISRQWAGNGTPYKYPFLFMKWVFPQFHRLWVGMMLCFDIKKQEMAVVLPFYERVPALTPKIFADSANACKIQFNPAVFLS